MAKVYVHEAFSAGSLDSSSVVVPAGMDRVALGKYEEGEFTGPLMDCLKAQLVVSSGLKIDKLDDLEAMIDRGKIRLVLAAGSLAMGLKKAAEQLDGRDFSIGVSEDPAHSDKPYYIPPKRIEQAKKLVSEGRAKGIEFVMPADFVLSDGRVATALGPGRSAVGRGPGDGPALRAKGGPVHRCGQIVRLPGRGLPQRRFRHVRGPAVRGRHQGFHPAVEADARRGRPGLRGRRRGRRRWRSTGRRTG